MEHYFLFVALAAGTVMSPGPGVAMTLTNSVRYGLRDTFGGIAGIALGALLVATLSVTGLGLLLKASAMAFEIMKFVGAAYLIYLGIKMWRSPALILSETVSGRSGWGVRFIEAIGLQLSNPKAIFFFLSIFPQFIDESRPSIEQFAILATTYVLLVLIIHLTYAITAHKAKGFLSSSGTGRLVNRIGGGAFIFFGSALATTSK